MSCPLRGELLGDVDADLLVELSGSEAATRISRGEFDLQERREIRDELLFLDEGVVDFTEDVAEAILRGHLAGVVAGDAHWPAVDDRGVASPTHPEVGDREAEIEAVRRRPLRAKGYLEDLDRMASSVLAFGILREQRQLDDIFVRTRALRVLVLLSAGRPGGDQQATDDCQHDRPNACRDAARYPCHRHEVHSRQTVPTTVDAITFECHGTGVRLSHTGTRLTLLVARAQLRRAAELDVTRRLRSDLLSDPR